MVVTLHRARRRATMDVAEISHNHEIQVLSSDILSLCLTLIKAFLIDIIMKLDLMAAITNAGSKYDKGAWIRYD